MANNSKEMKIKLSFDISDFEAGLKKIDKNMKLLDSQTKVTISSLESFGRSTDTLKAKADGLSEKIQLQKDKVEALKTQYQQILKEKGADADATQNLQIKLNNATTSLNKMQTELKQLNQEIRNQPTVLSNMSRGLDNINRGITNFGSKVASFGTSLTVGITTPIVAMAKLSVDAIMGQIQQETKLMTVMKQRMNVTQEQFKSVVDLTSAQMRLGIIEDDVQLAGAQQVATFLKQASSVNVLLPAMNNLLAQQKGYKSTTEDAVNVANMMGKVLDGNVGALKRVGISFTEAEEKILKHGNESERTAMLAQVINNNVGQMNQSLAQTTEGRIVQIKNAFGDFQEMLGARIIPLIDKYVPKVTNLINSFLDLDEASQNNILSFGALFASIPPALIVFGKTTEIIGNTSNTINAMSTEIKDMTGRTLEFSKTFGLEFGGKIQKISSDTVGFINKISKGGIDKLTGTFGTLADKIKNPIANFVTNVKMPISNMTLAEDFEKYISPVFGKLQSIFGKLGAIAQTGLGQITNIARYSFKACSSSCCNRITTCWNGISTRKVWSANRPIY